MVAHEFASVFPLMPEDQIRLLAADILIHGLHTPIMLHPDGRILDGRARQRACELINVTPTTAVWNGIGSPFVLLVHLNLKQRQLTVPQIALASGRIYLQQPKTTDYEILLQQDVASLMGISVSNVRRAIRILSEGVPELVSGVDHGTITIGTATEIVLLPADEQREVIASGTAATVAYRRRCERWPSCQKDDKAVTPADRRVRIRELAAAGYDSAQIAAAIGISQSGCRVIMKKEGIACPGDNATRGLRRHDPARIVDQIVMDADSLFASESLIDYANLHVPSARLAEWITTLDAARESLGSFIRKLRKEKTRHDDEAA